MNGGQDMYRAFVLKGSHGEGVSQAAAIRYRSH